MSANTRDPNPQCERTVAAIDSRTAGEVIAHCRESLTEYKVPRTVDIRETLPMSAVGKILYRVLRDEHAASATHIPVDSSTLRTS